MEKIYDLNGTKGRHLDVYEDKVVITTVPSLATLFAGNATDGEKTIYFADCIGIQFKKSGFGIGYLQFETASGIMNNRRSNFFNENTFTWAPKNQSNEKMQEVSDYCKKRITEIKTNKNSQNNIAQISPADELKKFKELLDMGIITEEEFNAKKKEVLGL